MDLWVEQEQNAITSVEDLTKFTPLAQSEIKQLLKVSDKFSMKITPYYLKLIDFSDPKDPLKLMAVPSRKELNVKKGELADPIGDTNEDLNNQPVQAITHRYPDRVLLYPTPECGGYCRHCFRRRLAGKKEFGLTQKQLMTALNYIREHSEIHEVILTGGDPLMLSDKALDSILGELKSMPHIWTIRIHSRMPVWNPYRLTPELAQILAKYHPVWLVTHFNHAREVTDIAVEYIKNLISAGVPVLNQSVLLKGVNDSAEALRDLFWALVRARIKPYYLHHLDKAQGISHFRVGIRKGLRILRELRGTIPGYAIPHYILDIPGGYGKVPMQYHYLNTDCDDSIIVETPDGELQPYRDNVNQKEAEFETPSEMKPLEDYPEEIVEKMEGDKHDKKCA